MLPTTEDYVVPCSTELTPAEWFSNRLADVAKCKAVCGTCKIRLACAASALEYEALTGTQMVGTQGGMSVKDRRETRMRRIA